MLKVFIRLKLIPWILIILVSIIAYGLTLGMFIWQDDNAIFFKLQHLQVGAGNLGTGIYDKNSAYRFVIVPLVPVFYLFGVYPAAYFLMGIVWFIIAAFTVYLLTKLITNHKPTALTAALIFASGFIGAETMWRIFNASQTLITLILINLSLYFFLRSSKKSPKLLYYLISLILFTLVMEIGYVRAHGIFWAFLALELFLNFKLTKSILRLLPFFFMFGHWYLFGNSNNKHISLLLEKIFVDYKFDILLVPLKTLENAFIPNVFNFPLWIFLIVLLVVLIKFRDRVLLWSLVFIAGNYVTYFFIYHDAVLNSTHRYLTISSSGAAIFTACLLGKIKDKKLYKISAFFVIALHLILVNIIQWQFLEEKSTPAKKFYTTLKKEIGELSPKSALFFDIYEDRKIRERFQDFFNVGSMPDTTAIAIHFNLDRDDLYLPQSYRELLNLINEGKVDKNNIYTFFFDENGNPVNTTRSTKATLFNEQGVFRPFIPKTVSSSPLLFSFNVTSDFSDEIPIPDQKQDTQLINYLDYLRSKNNYYQTSEATASSDWKYQEIKYINDNNQYTSWMANRVNWHYHSNEDVIIDLGEIREVGAVKIVFGPSDKTATNYSYYCSADNVKWEEWKKVYFYPKSHAEVKVDALPRKFCRYVKINLLDSVNNDAPVIADLEVINSEYSGLDLKKAEEIYKNPFSFVNSKQEQEVVKNYFSENGIPAKICFITDKYPAFDERACNSLTLDVGTNMYTTIFSPQGTTIKEIKLLALPSVEAKFDKINYFGLTFKDIYDKGFINNLR